MQRLPAGAAPAPETTQNAQGARQSVPEYWPNGQPPAGEDWAMHGPQLPLNGGEPHAETNVPGSDEPKPPWKRPQDIENCDDVAAATEREDSRIRGLDANIRKAKSRISYIEQRIPELERRRTPGEFIYEMTHPNFEIEPRSPDPSSRDPIAPMPFLVPIPSPAPMPGPFGIPGPILPIPVPVPIPGGGGAPKPPFEIGIDPKSIRSGSSPRERRLAEARELRMEKETLENRLVTWESSKVAGERILEAIRERGRELNCSKTGGT